MKVHKPDQIPAQPVNAPLFTGGPVTRQTLPVQAGQRMHTSELGMGGLGREAIIADEVAHDRPVLLLDKGAVILLPTARRHAASYPCPAASSNTRPNAANAFARSSVERRSSGDIA
jgi:hypothetical protein